MMPTDAERPQLDRGVPYEFMQKTPGDGEAHWRQSGAGANSSVIGSGYGVSTDNDLSYSRLANGGGRGDIGNPEFLLLCTEVSDLQTVTINLVCRMQP